MQELLQPLDGLGIEVVGGLVEQQHVGLGQQQAAQRDAALLAAGQRCDLRLPRRQAQRVGGDLQLVLDVVAGGGQHRFVFRLLRGQLVEIGVGLGVGGIDFVQFLPRLQHLAQALLDRLAHGLVRVELRLLRQIADRHIGHGNGLALDVLVQPGHDLEHGGLARAVQAEHADLGAGEKAERDVLEDLALGRNDLAHAVHGEDVLSHFGYRGSKRLTTSPQSYPSWQWHAARRPASTTSAYRSERRR